MSLISILLFGVSAWAAEIKLKDGTLIEGEIGQDKLKLRTSYGEMEINVKDISFIVEEKITLRDGSILDGDIIDPQLAVMTRYGELKVNTKDIASIVFAEEALETETKAPAIAEEKLPAPVIVEEPQNNKDYRTIAIAFDALQFILGQASDMLTLAGNVEYAITPNISLLVDIAYVSASGISGFQIGGGARYYSRLDSNILLIFLQALAQLYNPWGYYPYSTSYAVKMLMQVKVLMAAGSVVIMTFFLLLMRVVFKQDFLRGINLS